MEIELKFFNKNGEPTEPNEFTVAYQKACKVMDDFYYKWCQDVSELELRLMWQHTASLGLDTACSYMLFGRPKPVKPEPKKRKTKKK